jgi:hypothetical protein
VPDRFRLNVLSVEETIWRHYKDIMPGLDTEYCAFRPTNSAFFGCGESGLSSVSGIRGLNHWQWNTGIDTEPEFMDYLIDEATDQQMSYPIFE